MPPCLNCGHQVQHKFCPFCGQKADIKRLTLASLSEELLHFFTHIEKGFLLTSWKMIAAPGQTTMCYLKGQRKKYQRPISYFLIWTGLYILAHNFIINHFHYQLTDISVLGADTREKANLFLRKNFTIFLLPIILVASVIAYLILSRPRFNFIETLAISIYGGGTYFMFLLISDLVLGILFRIDIISAGVFLWQSLLSSVYNFWFTYTFFRIYPMKLFWPRLILVAFLVAITGWALLELLPFYWIRYFH